jgi:hypothetical protein
MGNGDRKAKTEMHMNLPILAEKPDELGQRVSRPTSVETSSAWHDIAGLWLRNPGIAQQELETIARRQLAVRRWRGLPDERPRPF